MGPCLCGDSLCLWCGNPTAYWNEVVMDWLIETVLIDVPPAIDAQWLAEELTAKFCQNPEVFDALFAAARNWESQK